MIHSVDSFRLLQAINSEAQKINRVVDCLLQFHIAREETKSGFTLGEANEMASLPEFSELLNTRICGVMGMASFTDDMLHVRREFRYLRDCFKTFKEGIFLNNNAFNEISMGMSGDYMTAIEEGSTMIRIGSVIFGGRK
jgi:pyridoxal phosphate enzyme (YggS family)